MTGFVSSDPLNNLTNVYDRPIFIAAGRNPTVNDSQPPQTTWQNGIGNPIYTSLGKGIWVISAGSGGDVLTINSLPPTGAGNITIAGTPSQIAVANAGSTVTLSLTGPYTPTTYTAHGVLLGEGSSSIGETAPGVTNSVLQGSTGADPAFTTTPTVATLTTTGLLTGGTGITSTTGNITATAGNFVSSTAGNGIVLNSGTASGTTTATLNGRSGQVTITTPSIAAGATFSFALTNSSITASTTQVLYGLTGGTTGSAITIQSVTNSAGTSTVVLQNASAVTSSTGSLVLTFLVLN
jgi:hypothetical protein